MERIGDSGVAAEETAPYGDPVANEAAAVASPGRPTKVPEGPKWSIFPDLLLIDGGKGQLSAALDALVALGLGHIPAFGLAKEEEVLYAPNLKDPIVLPRGSDGLFLLQRVRDEAHRFAVTFHRQRHSKATSRSALDDVPGIGPKRKRALLRHFGSFRRVKEASVDELMAVPGMGREVAERLIDHLDHLGHSRD